MIPKAVLTILFSFLASVYTAQVADPSFSYVDKEPRRADAGRGLHGVGLGLTLIDGQEVGLNNVAVLPVLPAIYYEYAYLIIPDSDRLNLAAVVSPQVTLPMLGFRLPIGLDLRYGGMATASVESGSRGLLAGIGHDYMFLARGFERSMTFVRAGVAIEEFFCVYQHSFSGDLYLGNLLVGLRLDI